MLPVFAEQKKKYQKFILMCHVCLLILTFYQSYQIKRLPNCRSFEMFSISLFVVFLSLYITMYLWDRHVLSMPDLSSICAHSTFVFSISISSIIIKHIWNLQFTVYSHEIKVEQTICHTYIYYLSVFVFYLVSLVLSSLFSWAGKMHVVLF